MLHLLNSSHVREKLLTFLATQCQGLQSVYTKCTYSPVLTTFWCMRWVAVYNCHFSTTEVAFWYPKCLCECCTAPRNLYTRVKKFRTNAKFTAIL